MKLARVAERVRNLSCQSKVTPHVCIVGAGPAGFYAAQQLIKTSSDVRVDILERLPVPFGLIRFGVAPDHPEVKNVINTFDKTARNSRVNFFGNVNVGKDVTVQQLMDNYHAVLLTYGAEEDRTLGINGENLVNVISARKFVGWYNGVPSEINFKVNLDVEDAVIIGQGNVAMDIARILLTPIDNLKKTDITSYALEQLSRSKVRKVWMVGRRGPLQAAFTIAELREILKLEGCKTRWRDQDFHGIEDIVSNLQRPRKRITELMLKSLATSESENCSILQTNEKELLPIFFRGPKELIGTKAVEKVRLGVTELIEGDGNDSSYQRTRFTEAIEDISCGLVVRSIGYRSIPIDPTVPFDNSKGRAMADSSGQINDNLYAAGWLATGPVGVILSTMNNAFKVGASVSKQLAGNDQPRKPGTKGLYDILNSNNVRSVSYEEWLKIDRAELRMGKELGKTREKIVDVKEMLKVAFE